MAPYRLKASVIVTSDRCARGEETDLSGTFLCERLLGEGFAVQQPIIVADDTRQIRGVLEAELESGSRLVITSGGTGLSPRDVTPDATSSFITTRLPGLEQLLMQQSLAQTPYAAFGRGQIGLTDNSPRALVVNIPGSMNAAQTLQQVLFPLLKHLYQELDQPQRPRGTYSDHL